MKTCPKCQNKYSGDYCDFCFYDFITMLGLFAIVLMFTLFSLVFYFVILPWYNGF